MRFLSSVVVTSALLSVATIASADETASATLVVAATLHSRTSLHVSADMLQFAVGAPDQPAVATVDFSAGIRTLPGAEGVLSVEPTGLVEGPGGSADVESSLTFSGEGNGMVAGTVATVGPTVAGRWAGSGLRQGRLIFALRTTASGNYSVPVRFVLTAP